MKKRSVFSLSGARADYGRLASVWRAIERHPRLELVTLATGAHLLNRSGHTIDAIRRDGFKIDYVVDMFGGPSGKRSMPKALGIGLAKVADIIEKRRPDLILVQGDRSEMLIPAIVGTHLNIPVAHLAGGFVTEGIVDEVVRHSLTKMSHIHFATSRECAERIRMLGEERWRVHFVGSPAIDILLGMRYESRARLFSRFGFDPLEPLFVMTYHPVTTEAADIRRQITEVLAALKAVGVRTVITYPNEDLGGSVIRREIEKVNGTGLFTVVRNLSTDVYLNFLKEADLIIGNSSSGFVEAPYFHLPMINIGNRQMGREKLANVIDAKVDAADIVRKIDRYKGNKDFRSALRRKFDHPYGNGDASRRMADILASVELGRKLIQKRITF